MLLSAMLHACAKLTLGLKLAPIEGTQPLEEVPAVQYGVGPGVVNGLGSNSKSSIWTKPPPKDAFEVHTARLIGVPAPTSTPNQCHVQSAGTEATSVASGLPPASKNLNVASAAPLLVANQPPKR